MYVGVILSSIQTALAIMCIPHVCGGDPVYLVGDIDAQTYSPCMWG